MAGACRLGVGYCKQAGRARFRKDRELGRRMSSCACVAGWPVNRPITKAMNQSSAPGKTGSVGTAPRSPRLLHPASSKARLALAAVNFAVLSWSTA
jgi:hypothetical protein